MKTVYVVMSMFADYCERYDEPSIVRIFDSREKAIEYIVKQFGEMPYEYIVENNTYECETDYGSLSMHIEEHKVY